jgi:hypothetical protein
MARVSARPGRWVRAAETRRPHHRRRPKKFRRAGRPQHRLSRTTCSLVGQAKTSRLSAAGSARLARSDKGWPIVTRRKTNAPLPSVSCAKRPRQTRFANARARQGRIRAEGRSVCGNIARRIDTFRHPVMNKREFVLTDYHTVSAGDST